MTDAETQVVLTHGHQPPGRSQHCSGSRCLGLELHGFGQSLAAPDREAFQGDAEICVSAPRNLPRSPKICQRETAGCQLRSQGQRTFTQNYRTREGGAGSQKRKRDAGNTRMSRVGK